ncbi:hypothetical protein B5G04_05025 [Bacteroides sp. An51A]|nr:hypothetical protein B5G04_05025 [Bacteroides sp. An51A]
MFIISLYHIDLIPLPHKPQRYTYGQSQINHIKGLRTQLSLRLLLVIQRLSVTDTLKCIHRMFHKLQQQLLKLQLPIFGDILRQVQYLYKLRLNNSINSSIIKAALLSRFFIAPFRIILFLCVNPKLDA